MIKKKRVSLAVFSRHPTHNGLRKLKLILPVATSIRFGSHNRGRFKYVVELNKPDAVLISSNKKLMKQKLTEAGTCTPFWWIFQDDVFVEQVSGKQEKVQPNAIRYPVVCKSLFGSRGRGNFLIKTYAEMQSFLGSGRNLQNYIFETFYSYSREYRLHVSELGCFYSCRKMLKADTSQDKRWYRNDSNCVWIVEDNPNFKKPETWDRIVNDCVKGLKAIGLDLAAFDVKVSAKTGEYIVIESNSAPSFGDITLQKYSEEILKIVNHKIN